MKWATSWREETWSAIKGPWDILIIGGGITGAGLMREAVCLGAKVLLVDMGDFAWGTSSKSSKMVHGGLRYLQQGQFHLTFESVRAREQLLHAAPGLVSPLSFLLASYQGDRVGPRIIQLGVAIYDLMAGQWQHQRFTRSELPWLAPRLNNRSLISGLTYEDAQTDDARLVFRLIREASAAGGSALNYVRAVGLIRNQSGVSGARLRDECTGREADLQAKIVINATGAWSDQLRAQVGGEQRLRPLRGSHLILPGWRLPVAHAISFAHPVDGRYVFIFPWENVTVIGTTDIDHQGALDAEPHVSPQEVAYLMAAACCRFPSLELTLDDVLATFAGIRPVIDTGASNPSDESREHAIWQEEGLLTVTGGKLTTFRTIAHDALRIARQTLPDLPAPDASQPILQLPSLLDNHPLLTAHQLERLQGRYGQDTTALLATAMPEEFTPIGDTPYLWAELRWAAAAEGVVHLEDLLLRRVRLGLLLPDGGLGYEARIRAICQETLGWNDCRWTEEVDAYRELWTACYGLPPAETIPNWQPLLTQAQVQAEQRTYTRQRMTIAGGLLALAALLSAVFKGWAIWARR